MIRSVLPVEVEVNGVLICGCYALQSGMLTVWHAHLGSRTRMITGERTVGDAQDLLFELYQAAELRLKTVAKTRR